jgi:hypothetical protein
MQVKKYEGILTIILIKAVRISLRVVVVEAHLVAAVAMLAVIPWHSPRPRKLLKQLN